MATRVSKNAREGGGSRKPRVPTCGPCGAPLVRVLVIPVKGRRRLAWWHAEVPGRGITPACGA